MRVPGVRFVQGRNRYGTSPKYAIAVHCTANTASAANEAAYATRRTDGTSSHFYGDNVEVVQSLDTNDRAGHAGSTQGNTYAIAVEFTGLNSWSRSKWLSSVAWEKIGAALAAVSRHHGIPATRASVAGMRSNPRIKGSYDHNQMRLAWGGTDHTDPGPNFPWDHFLAVWQRHLNPPKPPAPKPPAPVPNYQEVWEMDLSKAFFTRAESEDTIYLGDGGICRTVPNMPAYDVLRAKVAKARGVEVDEVEHEVYPDAKTAVGVAGKLIG